MKALEQMPEIDLDTNPHETQLEEAEVYFHVPETNNLKKGNDPYTDKDGLVQFICGVGLGQDPVIKAKLNELRSTLIELTAIVDSYIVRSAQAKGAQYKTDIQLWSQAYSKLPLMGPSRLDTGTFDRRIQGTKIAGEFLSLILDIVPKEDSALNTFRSYLGKEANALRDGIATNKDAYKTMTVGITVEVFKIGDRVVYMPKIKLYQATFTRENSKWSGACSSPETVAVEIKYSYATHVFDYEALSHPEIKRNFETFISRTQQTPIKDASTFFNDDFNVTG